MGDCADMDDEQIFCVGQCMAYCTATNCEKSADWSPCQKECNAHYMEVPTDKINFVDYSTCMAKCSSVPVSPWGAAAIADVLPAELKSNCSVPSAVVCCHEGCGDGHPVTACHHACHGMPDGATFAFSSDHGNAGCNC